MPTIPALRRITLSAVFGALTAAITIAQSPPLPFLGNWKINPAKSDLTETRLTFTPKPSGEITVAMQGMSYDFRIDGKPYPSPMSSTATWTATGPRSWRTLYRINNVDNSIDTFTLSDDGKTLTMKTDLLVPAKAEQTITFTRVGTGDGLIGTWQGKAVQIESGRLQLSPASGGKVQLRLMPSDFTALLTTDGVEAPVTGPAAAIPPGMGMALKVTGPRTFDWAWLDKGKQMLVYHATMSADGRTLTLESVNGPPESKDRTRLVFEREP